MPPRRMLRPGFAAKLVAALLAAAAAILFVVGNPPGIEQKQPAEPQTSATTTARLDTSASPPSLPAAQPELLPETGLFPLPQPRPDASPEPKVTLVRVDKSDRKLELLAGDTPLRTYSIALGGNPVGHKQQQGDQRTPEGRYVLDWRNPNSSYYRSLHVSYPNNADRRAAQARGIDPGGDIMIHGQPNAWKLWTVGLPSDWTLGCIAVTNQHMDEIWDMVEDGTPIEINP